MSPLKTDTQYRGAHASHVEPHPKLGKHKTILTTAVPLMNWLIDDENVVSISFGKLAHAAGTFTPRVECSTNGQKIQVLLVEKSAAQALRVFARKAEHAPAIAERIKSKWDALTKGNSTLRVVSNRAGES